MRSYVATFTHPTLGVAEVTGFLEHEFSLDQLEVQRSGGAPFRFRVTFRHPWLDPATMDAFLARAYAPDKLRIRISGAEGISRRDVAPAPASPQTRTKTTKARREGRRSLPFALTAGRAAPRERAIMELFASGGVVNTTAIRAAAGAVSSFTVHNLVAGLIKKGRIRRVGQGRYIAADRPDPAPEEVQAQRLQRKARQPDATALALEGEVLDALARSALASRSELHAALSARTGAAVDGALRRLLASDRVRKVGRGLYQAASQPQASPDEIEAHQHRQRPVASPKAGSPKPPKVDAALMAHLGEPRTREQVAAFLRISRQGADARLKTLRAAGKVHRRKVQGQFLYCADEARLPPEAPKPVPQPPHPPAVEPEPPPLPLQSAPDPEPKTVPVREAPPPPASRRTGTLRAAPRSAAPKAVRPPGPEETAPGPSRAEEPAPARPAAARAQPSASAITEDLLSYLAEPRNISEITNRLGQSHAAVIGRLEALEREGRLFKARQGLRFLYCVDPERLAASLRS